jgi:Ca-activated chloride channel family protein
MFEQQGWLLVLLLIPAIIGAGFVTYRRRSVRLVTAKILVAPVMGRHLRLGLWGGAAACAIVALANPVWGIEAELIEARGTAVVLVMDVSASMDALDLTPSRLERAKIAAMDILSGGSGDLFGLVLFAGEAFVQFPLTTDVETAASFVQSARSAVITRQGTAIEAALGLALDVIDERVSGGAMIVLMTDGENQTGDPMAAADAALARGIPIHVIGYGTPEGDVIPVYDENGAQIGVKANAAREIVISRLDEPALQAIAERAGGTYQRASETGIESVEILNQLAGLDAGALGARLQTISVSRYAVFAAIALLLLTFEMLVRERTA